MDVGELLSSLGEDDVKKLKDMASQFFGAQGDEKPEKGSAAPERCSSAGRRRGSY